LAPLEFFTNLENHRRLRILSMQTFRMRLPSNGQGGIKQKTLTPVIQKNYEKPRFFDVLLIALFQKLTSLDETKLKPNNLGQVVYIVSNLLYYY